MAVVTTFEMSTWEGSVLKEMTEKVRLAEQSEVQGQGHRMHTPTGKRMGLPGSVPCASCPGRLQRSPPRDTGHLCCMEGTELIELLPVLSWDSNHVSPETVACGTLEKKYQDVVMYAEISI